MFNANRQFSVIRFGMILVLLGGMLGITPAEPALAATLTVTTMSDSGAGSLRQAIADAASGDTIVFAPSLAGQTINLLSPVVLTNKKVTLDGSGLSPQVTINGGGTAGFVFNGPTASMDIYDLVISNFASRLTFRMDATIQNSTLRGFTNDVIFSYGSLTIIDSTLENNDGQTIAASGPVTITNSVLQNNADEAILVSGGSELTIMNSIFRENGSDAITASGPVTVIGSTVMGNSGRGILVNGSSLSLVNSTIYQNLEEAITINANSESLIVNSTIAKNQGTEGQIFVNGSGTVDISNSIIVGTTNPVFFLNAGTLNLYNSSLVCTHDDECFLSNEGTVNWFDSSVFPNATWEELGLGEPADNGGPTPTMALLPGSFLINQGDDTICANPPVNNLDQRGVARPYGEHCDLGAYEYNGFPAATTVTTITTSPNPSEPGQAVVATATVSPNNATGTVDVSVNDNVICTITLVEGTGSCNLVFFSTALVEAAYIPNDTSFEGSSGSTTHEVGKASTITTITDTADPSGQGEVVTIYVSVNNVYGDISIPTGTVEVTTAAGNCTVTLAALGQGSCTVTYNSPGVTAISAAYSGDAHHLPSNDTDPHEVLETTSPTVTSIVRAGADPTSAATVQFTVTFSEPVDNVGTEDFTLDVTGTISGATVDLVTGSADTYTVTVGTGTGNGTLKLNVPVGAGIADLAGNPLADLPYTSGQAYMIVSMWYLRGIGSYIYGASTDIPVPADYNGDGKAEIAVFRPSNGTWYVRGVGSYAYGAAGDIPVVADYNGDDKDDIAVFRPSNSTWYIRGVGSYVYGTAGDIPVVVDYNGDGKSDIAVFRPSNSTWYIRGIGSFVYGTVGDIPVVADYNGDGTADIAVFRPSNSTWYIRGVGPSVYGTAGDIPVVADYNGDGKADIAVFRPSNSTWYIRGVGPSVYGTLGDIPVVADYNGDGLADIAVFRP